MKKISFLAVILLLSVSAFAILPPGNIQAAFKKMYPKANGIAWSQDDGYYCANFVMNGFTKNVWFNTQAQWQMTQTDLVSLDRVTPTVYNAFVSGPYASWVVNDVTMVEFPKWQAIIVIKVGQDNVDIKYQLFYSPQGMLLKTRNVSYMHDILGPGTKSPCQTLNARQGLSYFLFPELFLLSQNNSCTCRNIEFQPLFLFLLIQRIGNREMNY